MIDADELLIKTVTIPCDSHKVTIVACFVRDIDTAPTIDAVPVVHSRWLGNSLDGYYCKNCLEFCLYNFYEEQVLSKYCPRCGATMDGDTDAVD